MPQPMAEQRCPVNTPHRPHSHLLDRTPWMASCPGIKEAD